MTNPAVSTSSPPVVINHILELSVRQTKATSAAAYGTAVTLVDEWTLDGDNAGPGSQIVSATGLEVGKVTAAQLATFLAAVATFIQQYTKET